MLVCQALNSGELSLYMAITKNEVLMFTELERINSRPEPFQYYTAEELWTDG